ncbi:MAG: response regulator [Bdellovibrionota bacterium]
MEKTVPSVLIVDDDPDFLKAQEFVLSKEGVRVLTASSYPEALERIGASKPDLIISDIQMPGGTGIDLLTWANTNQMGIPIVLITGFLDLLTTQSAKELGAYGFLPKPVKKAELIHLISNLEKPPENPTEFSQSNYARVAIEDFVSGKTLAVSIYVRFRDGRFLKIAHTGEDLDFERINSLKDKGVHELWVEKEDFNKYIALNEKITKVVLSGKGENQRKMRLINHSCELAFENVRLMGLNTSNLVSAHMIFEDSLKLFSADGMGLDLIDRIHSGGRDLSSHSSAVGLLCTMIAGVMGWHSKKNIINLTLGGFLHDIGMLGLDFSLHNKDLNAMDPAARETYIKHSQAGIDALSAIAGVSSEVKQTILQHHENARGNGFPSKTLGSQIFPMARIVGLVDEFCVYWPTIGSSRKLQASEGLELLVKNKWCQFDKGACLALEWLLKTPNIETAAIEYRKELGKIVQP